MGLDTVELVLAFEDEFGIAIRDEDAEKMTTPGDVANYVVSHVPLDSNGPCPSQIRFHRLRSILVNVLGIPRAHLRPESSLCEIIKPDTRHNWNRIRNAIGTKRFPRLEREASFLFLVVLALPMIVAASIFGAGFSISSTAATFISLVILVSLATASMGTALPSHVQTVASLVPYIECDRPAHWTRATILARVIQITSEQLGIAADTIHEDSHFIHDLGAG